MARKKKRKAPPPPKRPATFKWVFDPDIPTDDLLEGRDLRPEGDLDEIVDSFVFMLEQGDYLVWEAVVCSEQELPLTKAQKKMLGKLLSFSDDEEDRVLPDRDKPIFVTVMQEKLGMKSTQDRLADCL